MKVEVFAMCDAATDSQGKLNMLGAFDTIYTKQVPSTHRLCAIAARLRTERDEEGTHKLEVRVLSSSGESMASSGAECNVRVRDGFPSSGDNFIVYVENLKLVEYGDHSVDLIVDGEPKASRPLFVRPLAQGKESQR